MKEAYVCFAWTLEVWGYPGCVWGGRRLAERSGRKRSGPGSQEE